ncbi:serine/threonine protein kinase [Phytophthora cinnamomi]|uniref:serine/threonine protein kinase n=1 Tax=Phytophthora cinnamomi TaxID=4785 RepID=UPI0035597B53|nr:serine/threonine protein kinase [Phytophthora cinnamomi]
MAATTPVLLHVRRQLSVALYGEVLECELPGDDEPVAVKCISLARAAEARRQMRTTREVDNPLQEQRVAELIMTNGGHRNVVQPLFHFTHQRRLYLVNELCRGGDLHSLVAARFDASSFLEEFEVLPLIHQVLEGVNYLHSTLDIAHRDLSLENVLLSRGGVCKITDFGLSTSARTTCEAVNGAVVKHGVGAVFEVWGHSHRISTNTVSLLEKMLQIDPRRRLRLDPVLAHPLFASAVAAE